jgi:hypothetical protein
MSTCTCYVYILQATGHEIPTVIKSCIRVLNLYGMHHQGIFRIPGSQVEINDLKNAFEKGWCLSLLLMNVEKVLLYS